MVARLPGGCHGLIDIQELAARDAGAVMGRLRAVGAVFRASAGLHVEQDASLYDVRAVMGAVDELRPKDQVQQRRRVDFFDFGDGPVVAHRLTFYGMRPSSVSAADRPERVVLAMICFGVPPPVG